MARPVFCGNFEYDARESEIQRLFTKYGRVDRIDMKTGFAFVYMEDDRDAEDAIRALDRLEFGRQRRRLVVEWAKQVDGAIKRREDERRNQTRARPSKTLFVVNFDPIRTRNRDLEKLFEPYGRLVRVQIKKNFAFVQYVEQDDATKALDGTNGHVLDGRELTVEYAAREDGDGPGGFGGPPPRSSSPYRGGDSYGGRGRSPDNGYGSRRSPEYDRYRSRSPPRRTRDRSPDYQAYRR
eukprot:jgi/Mesen1/4112/ME000216S03373